MSLIHLYLKLMNKNTGQYSLNPLHSGSGSCTSTCCSNEDCMNMDSYRSKPGKSPVYSCPNATCAGGNCDCGTECKLDPYLGQCCQDLERIGTDIFCVEDKNTAINLKGDNLADDMILDSNGDMWDFIMSPNSAFKHQLKLSNKLQNFKNNKNMRQILKQKRMDQMSSGCSIPDQVIYNKNKTKYIIIPGNVICKLHKKYT